VLEMCPERKE
jgi:hypothetical protein